jgi:hypothetical protein
LPGRRAGECPICSRLLATREERNDGLCSICADAPACIEATAEPNS